MYVSHRHRAVFIHIPKTGGTAIRSGLLRHMDCDRIGHRHGTIAELPARAGKYYIFTVVRDPYQRFASQYRFRRMRSHKPKAFREKFPVMSALLEHHLTKRRRDPQIPPICQAEFIDGRVCVYRFEEIERAIARIGAHLGIYKVRMPRGRATHYLGQYDWRDFLDRRAVEIINEHCAADFEMYGYPRLRWEDIHG